MFLLFSKDSVSVTSRKGIIDSTKAEGIASLGGRYVASSKTCGSEIEKITSWLLDQELPTIAEPIQLRTNKEVCQDVSRMIYNDDREKEIHERLREISSLKLVCSANHDFVAQKVILNRFLNDKKKTWMKGHHCWPVQLFPREVYEFTEFSSYLCVAFYNLLYFLNSLSIKDMKDSREDVLSFVSLAKRQIVKDMHEEEVHGREKVVQVTFGDFLIARIIHEATVDLEKSFLDACKVVEHRRFLDYIFVNRWKAKVAFGQEYANWFSTDIKAKIGELNVLKVFWNERSAWDERRSWTEEIDSTEGVDEGKSISKMCIEKICEASYGESIIQFMAWQMSKRILKGTQDSMLVVETLNQILRWQISRRDQDEESAVKIVDQSLAWQRSKHAPASAAKSENKSNPQEGRFIISVLLEVMYVIKFEDVEKFFKNLWRDEGAKSTFARLCGKITYMSYENRLVAKKNGQKSDEIWNKWIRSISKLLWIAIRSGSFGQLFVGEFLAGFMLKLNMGRKSLSEVASQIPELKLYRLLRGWYRRSSGRENNGDGDFHGRLLNALRLTLARQNMDFERILLTQKAICKTLDKKNI